jgi:hypothetical protein
MQKPTVGLVRLVEMHSWYSPRLRAVLQVRNLDFPCLF